MGWDVVVCGAGHNGLTTAAYLAKAGFGVLVLDARSVPGGDTASEELTLPGFLHDSCSTAHNVIQANPLIRDDELGLRRDYGLEYIEPDPVVRMPFPDGEVLTMWRDVDATCDEIARFSPADALEYRRMMDEYDRIKGVFSSFDHTPIGWGPSLDELLAGHPDGARWMKIRRMSAADVIRGRVSHPHVVTFLLWMSFMTMQPPQRLGTGRLAYSLAYGRQTRSWIIPRGGSAALPQALVRLIEDHGGEVRTGVRVGKLVLEGGRCVGVEAESGEVYRARRAVVSSIHLKHLIDMAPSEMWDEAFRFGVDTWRPGVSMFVAHYATTQPPLVGSGPPSVAIGVGVDPDRMLRVGEAFDRGRVDLDDPPLLVLTPTVADPSRAPEGRHTLKVVGFQPYEIDDPGRWDSIRDEVAEANLAHLRRYAPNLTDDVILASAVKSPVDLERMNPHNWHGSCHGGDQGIFQAAELRPAPGWSDHRLPIPGLYQTGSTTHPGGSVSGGPGRNAARVLLADLGTSLEAVISA
ncbi:MAG: FAD-dependent oxidoreductase [Acidimicrobiia bacterium]|nr:MAG: FAD-dependent oxidoreductase [Acidimicrobiia bacterium]